MKIRDHKSMTKGRNSKQKKQKKSSVTYLLESGNLREMKAAMQNRAEQVKFQWDHYSELARQRNAIENEIKQSLIQTCSSFEIKQWQRAVKYKYSLHPLSTLGSLTFIGGRFNTGKQVNSEVPSFPALYLAENKDTALQEHLGQVSTVKNSKLTPRELALSNPTSETIVSISGKLDKVFDLTNPSNLKSFVALIKHFKISKELSIAAKNYAQLKLITTPSLLYKTLLDPNWSLFPSEYDVPANSQIFGHLLYSAGIEGIVYKSKLTNLLCIAIFPKNFVGTESFLALDDATPHPKVPSILNASNWRLSEMELNEIIN